MRTPLLLPGLSRKPFLRYGWPVIGLVLFLLIGAAPRALGQSPPPRGDWTFGGSTFDQLNALIRTRDGGYLLGGTSRSPAGGDKTEGSRGGDDYWVVRLDAAGAKVWDRRFGGNGQDVLTAMIPAHDGGYVLAGWSRSGKNGDRTDGSRGTEDYWVVKIDENGKKQWDETYGGNQQDLLTSITTSPDGGYVLAGASASDKSHEKGDNRQGSGVYPDYWIVKINAIGVKQWDNTIGGIGHDELFTIQPTTGDGGYVLGGQSNSPAGGSCKPGGGPCKQENSRGGQDYWVVKVDAGGNRLWDKTVGGTGEELLSVITVAPDLGFVLAGWSNSPQSGEKGEGFRGSPTRFTDPNTGKRPCVDYWVVKLDAGGQQVQWEKTLGGPQDDRLRSIVPTVDGGFLLGGGSNSDAGGEKTEGRQGPADYWLAKLTGGGKLQWERTIGGNGDDVLTAILPVSDGEYLLGGYSTSNVGGYKSADSRGGRDYWVVPLQFTPAERAIYVNAGGREVTTADGRVFAADDQVRYAQAGNVFARADAEIANTTEDELYRSERYGWFENHAEAAFSYNFPVRDGTYDVVLHFAEIWFDTPWGPDGVPGAGARKFNVDIEGQRKLTEFDIFAEAGGALRALEKVYRVAVTNGLQIDFSRGSANFPKVSAIEVRPAGEGWRVNAGGGSYFARPGEHFAGGERFYADDENFFSRGTVFQVGTEAIDNTEQDELYRSERWGVNGFSYRFPVPSPGPYMVVLHFAEIYFGNVVQGGEGYRKFDVDVEGERKFTEYDITARAGGPLRAIREFMVVQVNDGTLDIDFLRGTANFPKVSAIEVFPYTFGFRVAAQPPVEAEDPRAVLYPNPVQDRLYLRFARPVSQIISTAVTDVTGKAFLTNTHRATGEHTAELPVAALPKGLYLLRVQSASGNQVLKFIKQ